MGLLDGKVLRQCFGDTETLTLPTISHLRQRIRLQKNGARRDEQLLKHLVRVHRLMAVNS